MTLRRFARRWAVAAVLAALGMSLESTAVAQQGVLLLEIKSARPTPAFPQVARDVATPAPSAPIATLPSVLPDEPAPAFAVPDDGLGVSAPVVAPTSPAMPFLVPNAVAPAGVAAAPSSPCATCGTADGFNWAKVPVVPFVLPRPGFFVIPPTGPGYYTGLDCLLGNYQEKPPAYPYPRNGINIFRFFDFSFAYLDKPDNTEHDLLDPLKRIHLGDDWLLSFGGEYRYRHISETDYIGNKGGTNNYPNNYRMRAYTDLWYRDIFRIYVEGIDARVDDFTAPLVPGRLDQNHYDLLNAFIDVKIPLLDEGTTRNSYARVGRQELSYGSQRLVSTVDFSNTRGNNFQGVSGFSRGAQFDFDAFVVNPINHAVNAFDSVDDKQLFLGTWLTYRPVKGQSMELYYLNLSNDNGTFTGLRKQKGGFDVNTVGTRYNGSYNNFLWDFEGIYQFGTYVNQNSSAGATIAEVGYQFKDLPMNPQFWLGYDWASGGSNTGSTRNTFNQLFTFGHYYQGQADIVGRQNVNDLSAQFVFYPTNWITVGTQFHDFYLDNARDALYNKAGAVSRISANGSAGTNVGRELDFLLNFHLTNHSDIQLGYSHFFSGSFMAKTGSGKDIDFEYLQYTFRF
jgi:Alginate export